jgi:GxxExxY protein
MNTDTLFKPDEGVSGAINGAAYTVANSLGSGFLEKVYENALAIELRRGGHEVDQQKAMEVWYRSEVVGLYQADLLVDRTVVVELKALPALERIHRAQCLNCLRAMGLETGLVINFGRPRIEIQRVLAPTAH